MKQKVISNFEKQNIFEAQKKRYEFLQIFEDSENDEDNLVKLNLEVKKLKAGISSEIYLKIDKFIKDVFNPMVYEDKKVFERAYSHGEFKDNCLNLENEESLIKTLGDFFKILSKIESKLDEFVIIELHPYLIG